MPRTKETDEDVKKKKDKATRRFNKWNKKRTPLYSKGKIYIEYIPSETEKIVHCWHTEVLWGIFVTESGYVLSFRQKEPVVVAKDTTEADYHRLQIGTKHYRAHQLVWLSFAYNALQKHTFSPSQIYTGERKIKNLKALKNLCERMSSDHTKLPEEKILEVHHKDKNTDHNNLSNLLLVPRKMHAWLDSLPAEDGEELLNKIQEDGEKFITENQVLIVGLNRSARLMDMNEFEEACFRYAIRRRVDKAKTAYFVDLGGTFEKPEPTYFKAYRENVFADISCELVTKEEASQHKIILSPMTINLLPELKEKNLI